MYESKQQKSIKLLFKRLFLKIEIKARTKVLTRFEKLEVFFTDFTKTVDTFNYVFKIFFRTLQVQNRVSKKHKRNWQMKLSKSHL